MTVGRVAVEKNLEAFLSLDLPGSKVVIGDGPQKAELERRYPEGQIPRRKDRPGSDLASGGGGRLCVSEPHRHLRRRSTRSAGVRHAGRSVSGDGSARRDRGSSDRRAGYRSAKRLHPRARHVPRSLPEFCARAFLGKQRKAVHRQSDSVAAEPFAATRPPRGGQKRGARLTGSSEQRVSLTMAEIIKLDETTTVGLRPRDGRAGL